MIVLPRFECPSLLDVWWWPRDPSGYRPACGRSETNFIIRDVHSCVWDGGACLDPWAAFPQTAPLVVV